MILWRLVLPAPSVTWHTIPMISTCVMILNKFKLFFTIVQQKRIYIFKLYIKFSPFTATSKGVFGDGWTWPNQTQSKLSRFGEGFILLFVAIVQFCNWNNICLKQSLQLTLSGLRQRSMMSCSRWLTSPHLSGNVSSCGLTLSYRLFHTLIWNIAITMH